MAILSAGPHVEMVDVAQDVLVNAHLDVVVHGVPRILDPGCVVWVLVKLGQFVNALVESCL